MDFIKNCFDNNNAELMKRLKQANLPGKMEKPFLQETAAAVMSVIEKSNLEKTIEVLLSDNPAQLLQAIDVDAMAQKLELESVQVSTGLEAISPEVSKVFNENMNEIVAATASLAWQTSNKSYDLAENF